MMANDSRGGRVQGGYTARERRLSVGHFAAILRWEETRRGVANNLVSYSRTTNLATAMIDECPVLGRREARQASGCYT